MSQYLPNGIWRRVARYKFTDISVDRTVSIFRVEDTLSKQRATCKQEWKL
jgi:hypothetical protein